MLPNPDTSSNDTGYWASTSISYGPRIAGPRTFAISVTVDRKLQARWSGIRLLIVDSSGLSPNLTLREFVPTEDHPAPVELRSKTTERRSWRSGTLSSRGRSARQPPSHMFLPLICCLTPATVSVYSASYTLELGSSIGPGKKILFDRTFDSTEPVMVAFQGSEYVSAGERPVITTYLDPWSFLHGCECHGRMNQPLLTHHINVGSMIRDRSLSPPLPPNVVLEIARLCIARIAPGWRSELLRLGLLAKYWVPALDLFYMIHGNGGDFDPATLSAIANSLEHRPERGKFMSRFTLANYRYRAESMMDTFGSMVKLLLRTDHLVQLNIYPIAPSLYGEYARALANMRKIEHVELTTHRILGSSYDGRHVSVKDLQLLMTHWPCIKTLVYDGHDIISQNSDPKSSHDELDLQNIVSVEEPSYSLVSLELQRVRLCPSQLLNFVSHPPSSRLETIQLVRVSSPNAEFLLFLLAVSTTLSEIKIEECDFFTASGYDEENALDAAMPFLSAITSVRVIGDSISWRGIARKKDRIPSGNLSIVHASDLLPEMVLEALGECKWASVIIGQRQAVDHESLIAAEGIAKKIGVKLDWGVAY